MGKVSKENDVGIGLIYVVLTDNHTYTGAIGEKLADGSATSTSESFFFYCELTNAATINRSSIPKLV